MVENGSTDSTLADARDFAAGDPAVSVLTRPVPTTARRCGPGSSPPRARWSWCSSRLLRPGFVDVVLPLLTAVDGPAIVVGPSATRHPRHATVAAPVITAGFATVLRGLRASGVRHPRDEGDAQARSSRSWQCRSGTDLFDTELVLRADRAGLAAARCG